MEGTSWQLKHFESIESDPICESDPFFQAAPFAVSLGVAPLFVTSRRFILIAVFGLPSTLILSLRNYYAPSHILELLTN